ncbi:MAG: amidohydrolase family protein [Pseudomonadota bacterium]
MAVFEAQSGTVQPAMSVAIDGDRIAKIVDQTEPMRALNIIDGTGRLLAPGFVDTHTHALLNFGGGNRGPKKLTRDNRELLARAFLAYGTTTIADMGQPVSWVPQLQNWAQTPTNDAPNHVVIGGSLISDFEWNRFIPDHHRVVESPEAADETVAWYKDRGVNALKLYWKLGAPEYAALSEAGEAAGLALFTHVDNGIVSIDEAMANGVRHFEHFFTLVPSVMTIADERPALKAAFGTDRPRGLDEFAAIQSFYFAHIQRNPALHKSLVALLDRMAAKNVTISTTLNNIASPAGHSVYFSGFGAYPERRAAQLSYDDDQRAKLHTAFDAVTDYLKLAMDRGVMLRIGTDTRNGGEAMLAEMITLAEADFDMRTVLQIASINGARALGLDDDIGQIKPGHRADLVLLDETILENPRALLKANTVIKTGRVFRPRASRAAAALEVLKQENNPDAARRWLDENQNDDRYGPLQNVELETAFYAAVYAGNVDEARLVHAFARPLADAADTHFPDEGEINGAGYGLINREDFAGARAVLALNVDLFPGSANVYDSLGEVCKLMNDLACAEENYKRTLAINPENPNAKNVLKEITDLRKSQSVND